MNGNGDLAHQGRAHAASTPPSRGYFGQDALTLRGHRRHRPRRPRGPQGHARASRSPSSRPTNQPPDVHGRAGDRRARRAGERRRPARAHERPRPERRRRSIKLRDRRQAGRTGLTAERRRLDPEGLGRASTRRRARRRRSSSRITRRRERRRSRVRSSSPSPPRPAPLAVANTDTVPQADQGKTVTVPVLANDFNPFPDTPLKILVASTSRPAPATPAVQGDKVVVTPTGDFVGTLVVRYRIQDATERSRPPGRRAHRRSPCRAARRAGDAAGHERAGPHGRALTGRRRSNNGAAITDVHGDAPRRRTRSSARRPPARSTA